MNLEALENLNLPPWATLKNLALAAAGASALSAVIFVLWGLYVVAHGLIFATLCTLVQAAAAAVATLFFYVFWRKAR